MYDATLRCSLAKALWLVALIACTYNGSFLTAFDVTVLQNKIEQLRLLFMQRSYPEIFFKLLETTACDVLKPKFKVKKISQLKIYSFFKGFDREIINFEE